jgi:uroporphyrinogen III methyltransferase/synthase
VPKTGDAEALRRQIEDGQIDWLTFASPSAARNFFDAIPPEVVNASGAKVASIGPVTSEQLDKLGLRVDLMAAEYTTDGLLDAIEAVERGDGS